MKEQLEQYIDQFGLDTVLACLADICKEKAEHIRANWSTDKALARGWSIEGAALEVQASGARRRLVR
jgi:hypothetical protein